MYLIYNGAHDLVLRKILHEHGVVHVGFSFHNSGKWNPDKVNFDGVPEDFKVHLYPGSPKFSNDLDIEHFSDKYEQFIERNIERLTSFTDMSFGPERSSFHAQRHREFYDQFDQEMFRPYWRDGQSVFGLEELADKYSHVVIPKDMLNVLEDGVLPVFEADYDCRFHLFGMRNAHSDFRFDSVYQGVWYGPRRFGSTVLWDGKKLHNVNKEAQEEFRQKHRVIIGTYVDPDKVIANDLDETTVLAVESLKEFEAAVDRLPVPSPISNIPVSAKRRDVGKPEKTASDISTPEGGKSGTNGQRHKSHFPGMRTEFITSVTQDVNGPLITEIPVVESSAETVRNCDACALSRGCPAYEPESSCSFSLPVEMRTNDQIMAFTRVLLEMQAARVSFSRMAEELSGGIPTVETSTEMDRFMKMLKDLKKIEEQTNVTKITVEERKSSGVLSEIFRRSDPPPIE